MTFFSPAPDFLTSYNGTPFTKTPSHTTTAETQFVTVFRVLRLPYFFLLRARLNCSNKQFYGKRKNARSVRATRNVPSGFKTSDTKLFCGRHTPDWIVFRYHVSNPCLHFVFTLRHLPSPVPVLCGGLSQGPSSPSRICKNIARLWAPRRNRWLI